jgi:transcriptional regulator with XRE-family HTH domain
MDSKELRQRRESLGLTQGELAKLLGVSLNTVSRWELGSMKIRSPGAIALALSHLEKFQRKRS